MSRVSQRIAAISPSATLAIDAKAKAMRGQGIDVIGFGAGEPDFPTPAHIVEAARAACLEPRNHKYSATAGLAELRTAIADKTKRDSGLSIDPTQVLVTNGGKQAVYNAFATLLDPGDEVLLPAPYWVTYPEAIALAGGVSVVIPTDETSGFRVTPEALEPFVTERTKVFLFCSPSNPTGAVYTEDQIRQLGNWASDRGLWVVTDEIYEHLVYGNATFASMPVLCPDLVERCVVVNGVAKTYAMTGWRVGWLVAPNDVVAAATNLQSHATSNVNNIAQMATVAALQGPLDAVREMKQAFDRRRQTTVRLLSAITDVECLEPEGAFYAFPSFRQVLANTDRFGTTVMELAQVALEKVHVAFVPGEAFGAPGYARFSYALGDVDLERGLLRLAELLG